MPKECWSRVRRIWWSKAAERSKSVRMHILLISIAVRRSWAGQFQCCGWVCRLTHARTHALVFVTEESPNTKQKHDLPSRAFLFLSCCCYCVCVCVCVHACVCACMLACLHVCVLQNEIAAVMNRMFHYTGQFVPVKWKCRAKLPSGKLCERMDRIKVRMMAILTLKTILSAFNSEWTIQAILMIQTIPSAFNSEWTLSTHSKAGQ